MGDQMRGWRHFGFVLIVIAALTVLALPAVEGEIKDWTGTTNSNWGTASNWDPSGVPTSSDNIYIDDQTNDPVIQTDAVAYGIYINGSGILDIDGATLNGSYIQVEDGGTLDLTNDATIVNLRQSLHLYGKLDCGASNTPEINLRRIYMTSTSSTSPGWSTVTFVGGNPGSVFNNGYEELWDVVIDEDTAVNVTSGDLIILNDFTITNGSFDPNGHLVEVGDNLRCFDRIVMNDLDDNISIDGRSYFYSGSNLSGDDGVLHLKDWTTFEIGSKANFTGKHMLLSTGAGDIYYDIWSPDVRFNNVTTNKSSSFVAVRGYLWVHETITVEYGYFYVLYGGNPYNVTTTNLTIQDNGIFYLYQWATVNVTNDIDILDGGEIILGRSTTWGGTLNANNDIFSFGDITFQTGGGNLNVGDDLFIYSTANVTMHAGNITGTTDTILYLYGDLYINTNDTTVYFHNWYIYGSSQMWVANQATPELQWSGMIYEQGSPNVWHPGHSTFMAVGVNFPAIDARFSYYGVGVNLTSGFMAPGYDDILYIDSHLVIINGAFRMNDRTVRINGSGSYMYDGMEYTGFANIGGELTMESDDEYLMSYGHGGVYWGPDSTSDVDAGSINCSGDWVFAAGSDANLRGTNMVRQQDLGVESTYWINSSDSSFQNVTINSIFAASHLNGTETMVVKGDLTINGLTAFVVDGNDLEVQGDLNGTGGNLWVLGTDNSVEVQGDAYMMGSSLNLGQASSSSEGGTVEIDGYLSIDEGLNFEEGEGEVTVGETLFVSSTGVVSFDGTKGTLTAGSMILNSSSDVNLTGSGEYVINVLGDLRINGVLNMTNDNAILRVGGDLILPDGHLDCGPKYEPEIFIGGDFDWLFGGLNFTAGHSTVFIDGSGDQKIDNDFRFYGLVVNKTGGEMYFEWSHPGDRDIPKFESFFFIEAGTFNMRNTSIRVCGNGSGYQGVALYTGFVNLGGHFVMQNGSSTLEAFEDILWGSTATGNVTNGTIVAHDNWIVQGNGYMELGGDNLVFHKGGDTSLFNFVGEAIFNNFTMRKWSDNYETLIVGEGGMNVTNLLNIYGDSNMEVRSKLEATYIDLYGNSLLNMSFNVSELRVWETIETSSGAEVRVGDNAYAMTRNITGSGDIYLGTNTNLTLRQNMWMNPTTTLYPGMSTVYFGGKNTTQVRLYNGGFYNVIVAKYRIGNRAVLMYTASDYYIDGNLTLRNGTFYSNGRIFHLKGNFDNNGWCRFDPSPSGYFVFDGGGTQYIQTGGDFGNVGFEDLRVESSTQVIVQNYSMRIDGILLIEGGSAYQFKSEDGTLTLGDRGMFNDGTFHVWPSSGKGKFVVTAGTTVTNNATMYLVGNTEQAPLRIRSSSDGTQWNLEDNTASDQQPHVQRALVKDSDASGGNTIYTWMYCVDQGNNENWVFSHPLTIYITGLEGHDVNLTWTQRNSTGSAPISFSVLVFSDNDTTASIEDLYTVSSTERYYTEDTTSWDVTDNTTVYVNFYRQWKPTITLDGTDASHTVSAYYTALGGNTSQSGQHTSWSRWCDNGSRLSFSKDATGSPPSHTSEDFTRDPWDPLTSALVKTVYYEGNVKPELKNGTMDPSGGNLTTVFNFTVEYWDDNNDIPLFVYVNIDGTNYSMEKVQKGDHDYTDGCEYYYETKLSGGDHDYYFICNDSYETTQTSSESTGTIVPEFGMLTVLISVMMVGVAVMWRRRRRH